MSYGLPCYVLHLCRRLTVPGFELRDKVSTELRSESVTDKPEVSLEEGTFQHRDLPEKVEVTKIARCIDTEYCGNFTGLLRRASDSFLQMMQRKAIPSFVQ